MEVIDKLSSTPVRLPADKASLLTQGCRQKFDAAKHLEYRRPAKSYTMTELGLDPYSTDNNNQATAVLDFAVTEPFLLASPAGVKALRDEIFSEAVVNTCSVQITERSGETVNHWQLRNPAKQSKFIYDFWRSPVTNAAVCDALQYDVTPTMDLELGHTNFQLPGLVDSVDAVDGEHTDSNCQFVIILMLSDTAGVDGGETGIRRGDGSLLKIRYPGPGYAILLQGLNIRHAAMHATSGERLTMVTSYQPASHQEPQNSVLSGVRFYSDETQLFAEWTAWRLSVLSKQMADLAQQVEEGRHSGTFDLEEVNRKAAEFRAFLDTTLAEMK